MKRLLDLWARRPRLLGWLGLKSGAARLETPAQAYARGREDERARCDAYLRDLRQTMDWEAR